MATLMVPSVYSTIVDAMQAAQLGDTILLAAGYVNETVSVTVENITVEGDATNTGISLNLNSGIQQFTLAGSAPIDVSGNGDANVLIGNSGNNTLNGGGGDDTINSGSGNDTVNGGAGIDSLLVTYEGASTAVIGGIVGGSLAAGYGGSLTDSAGNRIVFSGIENFSITAGSGNDNIRTGDGTDTISTGAANDFIVAGGGDDSINPGDGHDFVDAGLGTDHLIVNYSSSTSNVLGGISTGSLAGGYNGTLSDSSGGTSVQFNGVENFSITTGSGNDNIRTGDGDDTITTGAGNDVITGGAGNNVISAGAGNDSISTGAGDDTIDAGSGTDNVGAGLGTDRLVVDYSGASSNVTGSVGGSLANGYNGFLTDSAGNSVGFNGIENFSITTGSGNDNVRTGDGDDVISTGAGNDFILTADGDDILDPGTGLDNVTGGLGADRLVVDYSAFSANVTGAPSAGSVAAGYAGSLSDSAGNTVTFNGIENFSITTGGGNDNFSTGDGNDTINTGAGNDVISAGRGVDSVDGGIGTDRLVVNYSSSGANVNSGPLGGNLTTGYSGSISDSAGNNVSFSGIENFSIITGTGDDAIALGRGVDSADGGTGLDRLIVDYSDAITNVTSGPLSGNPASGYSGSLSDLAGDSLSFSGIESFSIATGSGDDRVTTGDGNDTINSGHGRDQVTGGLGTDKLIVDYSEFSTNVSVSASGSLTSGYSGLLFESAANNINFSAIENFSITTGSGNDNITTGDGDDTISTGAGNDFINARAGNNVISAGDGNDTIVTGAGDDTIDAGSGVNNVGAGLGTDRLLVDYAGSSTNVIGSFSGSLVSGYNGLLRDGAGNSVGFNGIENFSITTGSGNDNIRTGDGDDVIRTGAGNDFIVAGAGDNTINAGIGDDLITVGRGISNVDGGAGRDNLTIDYSTSSADVSSGALAGSLAAGYGGSLSDAAGSSVSFSAIENFIVRTGTGNDVIVTGDGLDSITTGDGNDTISAGGGNDLISAGRGIDSVDGGTGVDRLAIDYSGSTTTVNSGALSGSFGSYSGSFSDSEGNSTTFSRIENFSITTGSGNDIIVTGDGFDSIATGEGDDLVTAGGSSDTLSGGGGVDTAVFSGLRSDYSITSNGDGSFQVLDLRSGSPDGSDRLTDFEFAQFSDTTVALGNRAPVANDDTYATDEDSALIIGASGVLGNDSDADGDALHVALVSGPTHGTLAFNADGSFTYTPQANYNGPDSFTYRANDGQADSNAATVSLTVNPVNDAPVAVNDSYSTNEDTALTVAAAGVLTNDTDADGDTLHPMLVSGPAHGTLSLNADGSFTYTPQANYNGPDSFMYRANDGLADSNVATVRLTVSPANDVPLANDDIAGVTRGQTVSTDALHGVLSNDSDLEGDPLQVSAINGSSANVGQAVTGTYGSLTLNADGSYSYACNKDSVLPNHAVARDTFTYTVDDHHGGTSTATLTVTALSTDQIYFGGTAGNDTLVGGKGRDVLDGGNGNDVLRGSNGTDFLIGGRGNDVLTGGDGDDSFVFAPHFGQDVITDYTPGTDFVQFDHALFANFSGVQAHAANDGQGNTVITYDANNTITLQHVAVANLHSADFLFV